MKRDPFLILGLPRSRTAWLSRFFTVGDVFCWHELSAKRANVEDMWGCIENTPAAYVGLSDPGLSLLLPDFWQRPSPPRVVFVRRAVEDSAHSLARAAVLPEAECLRVVELMDQWLWEYHRQVGGLIVDFDELDDREVLECMWVHLLPDVEFPRFHYEQMRGLKIEMCQARLREAAGSGVAGVIHRSAGILPAGEPSILLGGSVRIGWSRHSTTLM